jgi:hypothetical protein
VKVLEVNRCNLPSIGPLAGLAQLTKLDASYNNIIDMDDTLDVINNLQQLKSLDLSGNTITLDQYYIPKVLEATVSNQLSMLDMRALDASDYQLVIAATTDEANTNNNDITLDTNNMNNNDNNSSASSNNNNITNNKNTGGIVINNSTDGKNQGPEQKVRDVYRRRQEALHSHGIKQ